MKTRLNIICHRPLVDYQTEERDANVTLDFKNGRTIVALVDFGAYVIGIAESELERIKQQIPTNIFRIQNAPNFRMQVAKGQLEKLKTTTSINFDIGNITLAEHVVSIEKAARSLIGLHFGRHKGVVCIWCCTWSHPFSSLDKASQNR